MATKRSPKILPTIYSKRQFCVVDIYWLFNQVVICWEWKFHWIVTSFPVRHFFNIRSQHLHILNEIWIRNIYRVCTSDDRFLSKNGGNCECHEKPMIVVCF